MRSKRRTGILRRVILGFAVAALVAPAAEAQPALLSSGSSEAVHETDGRLALVQPQGEPAGLVGHETDGRALLVRPDGPVVAVHETDARMTQVRPASELHPQPVVVDRPAFDWGDAGIGAAFGLGLALLAAGAAVATRNVLRGRMANV
jgi:hypothetical protein